MNATLLLLLAGACRFTPATDTPTPDSPDSPDSPPDTPHSGDTEDSQDTSGWRWIDGNYSLAWGDLHAHTGSSQDGCEDETNFCQADGFLPGEALYANAAARALAFIANTDHGEVDRYQRAAAEVDIDVWEHAHQLLADAGPTGVIPILGYEYTSPDGHRTVLFDSDTVCDAYRMSKGDLVEGKRYVGLEKYTFNASSGLDNALDLETALMAAGQTEGCEEVPWLMFAHHPAYQTPTMTRWSDPASMVPTDSVVEIASEHGSSECFDLEAEGCDYRTVADRYNAGGSIQSMLQLGYKLGFVGGSDNHQGDGSVPGEESSYHAAMIDTDADGVPDTALQQSFAGAITGVYSEEGPLTRTGVFEALSNRNTLAATWLFDGVTLHLVADTGQVFAPGDDVPAGTYTLEVNLEDEALGSWYAEVMDPLTGVGSTDLTVVIESGAAPYVRVRAMVNDVEHRIWASPFFGI